MHKSNFNDKIFRFAFIVSLISHSFFLLQWPCFTPAHIQNATEIVYLKTSPSPQDALPDTSHTNFTLKEEVRRQGEEKGPSGGKESLGEERKLRVAETKKDEIIPVPAASSMQVEQGGAYKTPEYYNYYRYVRKRIEQAVYRPRPFKEGVVVVKFTLFHDGSLKEICVIDELSVNNPRLRYTAVNSVKEAAPFETFPKELKLKEIPFQIPVSFEFSN